MTDRRRFLLGAGAAALAAGAAACSDEGPAADAGRSSTSTSTVDGRSDDPGPDTSGADGATAPDAAPLAALTVADFDGLGPCRLLPEQMAGPFPLDEQFDRRDITEGVPGHPMRLGIRVVSADCAPVPGARVEVWHADSSGDYSAFVDSGGGKDEGPGTTFLRGTQTADADGIVEFTTIYPGWYTGRAVHIHVRVHRPDVSAAAPDDLVLTSQLYFDEGYTSRVYAVAPYAEFGEPDTTNEADTIAGDPPNDGTLVRTVAAETPNGRGTLGLVVLRVDDARRGA